MPGGESWREDRAASLTDKAPLVLTHLCVAVVALCAVNTGRAFDAMSESSPAPFWDTLRHDAERVGAATIEDSVAPVELVGGIIINDDGTISSMLRGLDLPLSFNTPTERYLVVNPDGHLVLSRMRDDALFSLPGEGDCGYGVSAGSTTRVTLDRDIFGFGWIVELTYFTETDAVVEVSTDETTVEIELPASTEDNPIRTRQFHIEGPVTFLDVAGVSGDNTVCVTEAHIGLLEPTDQLATKAVKKG